MDGKLFAVILITTGLFIGVKYLVSLVCRRALQTTPQTGIQTCTFGTESRISPLSNAGAYTEMLRMIRGAVRGKYVLELGAGRGMLAPHVVHTAKLIEAVDSSEAGLVAAAQENSSAKLHYSVQDMTQLPYADETFDIVILFDLIHSTKEPEKVLSEAKRVLTGNGTLILPALTDARKGNGSAEAAAYFRFLQENGLMIQKSIIWGGTEPLAYAECGKQEKMDQTDGIK